VPRDPRLGTTMPRGVISQVIGTEPAGCCEPRSGVMTTATVFGGAKNQLATPWLGRSEPVDGVNSDCATTAVVMWIRSSRWHRFCG
jgi:hypothetical protein